MKFEVYIIANRFEVLKRISVNSSLNLGLIFRSERCLCMFYKRKLYDFDLQPHLGYKIHRTFVRVELLDVYISESQLLTYGCLFEILHSHV